MRRRRREAPESGKLLLAGQHGLNGVERRVEAFFLTGDAPGVHAGEAQTDQHRRR